MSGGRGEVIDQQIVLSGEHSSFLSTQAKAQGPRVGVEIVWFTEIFQIPLFIRWKYGIRAGLEMVNVH